VVEFVEIAVLKRVLELGAAESGTDGDVLRHLQEHVHALHLGDLRPQPVDDLEGAHVALVVRLQIDEKSAVVDSRIRSVVSDSGAHGADGGVFENDIGHLRLQFEHGRIRDVLRGFGNPDNETGVLLRKESLGDDDVEICRIFPHGEARADEGDGPHPGGLLSGESRTGSYPGWAPGAAGLRARRCGAAASLGVSW
jgi:hypothetical protein